jgi:hypothetical protein
MDPYGPGGCACGGSLYFWYRIRVGSACPENEYYWLSLRIQNHPSTGTQTDEPTWRKKAVTLEIGEKTEFPHGMPSLG